MLFFMMYGIKYMADPTPTAARSMGPERRVGTATRKRGHAMACCVPRNAGTFAKICLFHNMDARANMQLNLTGGATAAWVPGHWP